MEGSEEEGWKVPTIRGVLVVDSKTGGGEDKSILNVVMVEGSGLYSKVELWKDGGIEAGGDWIDDKRLE